jgi:hypothetical protein
MVYDTCAGKIKRWSGSAWVAVADSGAGGGGSGDYVDTIYRKAGQDSIFYTINGGTERAVKDSVGSGGGGTPGGGLYSIQYNRSGAFAGRSTFVFDTVNARVGIGTASPAAVLSVTSASGNINSGVKITNTASGTTDYAVLEMANNVSDLSQIYLTSSTYSNLATLRARGGGWFNSGIGGLSFISGSDNANAVITFATGNTPVERMRVNSSGAVITSLAQEPFLINGTNSSRTSLQISNASTTGSSTVYLQNNRGSFATYGGSLLGGSVDGGGNLFGLQRRDRYFVFGDGASLLGMAVGTLSNQPLILGTNNAERIRVEGDGDVGIGTTAPAASSILDLTSTSKGFLPPRMTTAQSRAIASPAAGLSVYNSSLATNDVYTNAWYQQPNGLTGSGTLDFPSTGAHSSSDLTITVTGAAVGDIVILGTPVQDIDGTFTAFVSAANTVTVRYNHYGSGNTNPASGTFKVYVIKN